MGTSKPAKNKPAKKRPPRRASRIAKRRPAKGPQTAYLNICRQEKSDKTVPGWKVSFQRRGKYMHRYFSDKNYGGKTKGLQAAKAWRDSALAAISGANYILWRRNKLYAHNTSGIVGVGRYVVRYGKKKQHVWDAFWEDADGKRHCRRFFISAHGEKRAKALACAARQEGMEELRQDVIRRGATVETS